MNVIGCHLSDKEGFMSMALETTALHANSFQFFTRNPRGSQAKVWSTSSIDSYIAYAKDHEIGPIVGYAPYTDNAASGDMKIADFAHMVTAEDITRMEQIPGQLYVMHPGSATNEEHQQGVDNVISLINEVLAPSQTTTLCVVNTADAGHEVAGTFEEMGQIIDGIKLQEHVGVCLDVAAAWGAGYDMKDKLDAVLGEFDEKVGLDRLKVVHLADPKYDLGTHHAHHEPLGQGKLGMDALKAIYSHPKLAGKVFILETPHDDLDVYEEAIKAFTA